MATETQSLSGLERLKQKYNVPQTDTTPSAKTYEAFDKKTFDSSKKRLSKEPTYHAGPDKGEAEALAEIARIQLDSANLARKYGKLNINFTNMMGRKRIFTFGDALSYYGYSAVGKEEKATKVYENAIKRNAENLETLADKIGEILGEQEQKLITGIERTRRLHINNQEHIKTLDRRLIESLRGGIHEGVDLTEAEKELKKLEDELREVTETHNEYESRLNAAKASGNLEDVKKIAGDMDEILKIREDIRNGKLSADGVLSEIRRELLDKAEGVQSAKGAIAASEVNDRLLNASIDFLNELAIKYKHLKEDMIPVFKIQAAIAVTAIGAAEMKKTALEVPELSRRLLNADIDLIIPLAIEVFGLLQKPAYDVEEVRAKEEKLKEAMEKLNEAKKQWANTQQRLEEISSKPHYTIDQ
ncbi:hypothetical protein HYX19_01460 [Candidatus Woesearchaeota archaeon]|nr:hypothetical protein [Candidatus Woesearchaeota archaeon]